MTTMNLARSIALAARGYPSRNLQCVCGQTLIRTSRIQWTSFPQTTVRNITARTIHTSHFLQSLPKPKQSANPYVPIDRFQTGKQRTYNLLKLQTYREAYHDSPKQFIFVMVMGVITLGLLAVGAQGAYYTLIKPLHNYPEDVAKFIRRAIFYESKMDIKECMKNYQRAITASEMLSMDPLSDEVTGLKIMYAGIAEKCHAFDKGVEWLERLRFEMLTLMEERREELGTIGWLKVMKRVIGISVKIGDLQVLDKDDANAEKTYEWSVKEAMRVMSIQSRLNEDEERPWTVLEIAAIFESELHHPGRSDSKRDETSNSVIDMASFYERTNKFDYATTLYIQAANLFRPPSCHSVILLNNVGACNMQRRLPSGEPMDRETQLESAKKWMEKALDVASNIKPPARTEECDQGCVVALHNIGEVEEQLGKMDEAMLKFQEAQSLAFAIGFADAYQNAGVAQERIKAKQAGTYESPEDRKKREKEEQRRIDEARTGGLPPLTLSKVGPGSRKRE
ncbi:hypothetical protein TWF102_009495 [Orbilia oligospora]|uniref:Uncharacterized protein n=1 Tax=Orbilia oligospora TaxID=2813651 RepID=A0A7C8N7M3_ORBOL|nr:hypothetical protein TWF102_009495 [Orbilia oligospora]KAF3115858.1 hypothetical protein TWF706_005952 [Orbilia oligospora]KAF3132684.1 hypothetical protein TWF594_009501 [Orbilia oligospora]